MMLDSVTMDDMPELALSGPRAGIGPFETALSYIHADSHSILSLIELIVLGVGCLEIKLFSHEKIPPQLNVRPWHAAVFALVQGIQRLGPTLIALSNDVILRSR